MATLHVMRDAKLNQNGRVELGRFSSKGFDRGVSLWTEGFWVVFRILFFSNPLPWPSFLRVLILKLFGAKVGRGVVIRSNVVIWFPWKLEIASDVWVGDGVLILNLSNVSIGSNVCISQRAFICTGSHDYNSISFDLIAKPVRIEEGAWICAGSFIGPGVIVEKYSVVTAYSVLCQNSKPFGVYQGNPAKWLRWRQMGQEINGLVG